MIVSEVEIACQSPSLVFKNLKSLNPVTIIITSGTLSPIDGLEHELDIPIK